MCLNPLTIKNPRRDFNQYLDPLYLQVPCGHCLQCQRSKLIDLETRAVCEYENCLENGGRVFNYTLTYNEDCVPWYCGIRVLCRRDFQLFKKRLKKFLGAVGDSLRIAYFGEVGKRNTCRSHFHILIFSDIRFDPSIMAEMVKFCWNQGFIGYPNKMYNNQPLPPSPVHAVVDGVNALRYCIKYCAKTYDLYYYLFTSFTNWLRKNGVRDDEFDDFVFPDDKRFQFPSKNPMTLESIIKYFSTCYRLPNNFGASQINKLDSNFDYTSNIPYKGTYRKYHISRYCKNLLFNMTCVDTINNVKTIHKTKAWIAYNRILLPIFAQKYENSFISNQNLKLSNIDIGHDTIKSVITSLHDHCDCSLYDYYIFRTIYTTRPLESLDLETVLKLRQSRDLHYIDLSSYSSLLALLPHWLEPFADTLKLLQQEIYYQRYLKQYQSDIDYQNVKSAIYGTQPNYPIKLTFNQIVNPMIRPKPQPIESEQIPPNYGLVPSADGSEMVRAEVPLPNLPPVSSFDIDVLSSVGISPQSAPNILTPSIEEFQSTLDNIDFHSKPIES